MPHIINTATMKNNHSTIIQRTCPVPLRKYPRVVLGHGSGGLMTHELIKNLFLPAFSSESAQLTDAAVVPMPFDSDKQLVVTTDSFVVHPLVFPGGDIGSLAVYGSVNDLAMMGAIPLYLTVGFILEEGLPMDTLTSIVQSMASAAKKAGVAIITGDTKVVEKNHGDGMYINTSAIGVIHSQNYPHPRLIQPGDAILVNGTLGDHGMAIMSVRENLRFETKLKSDSASLHLIVSKLLTACPDVHALRDLTRGGLAAGLNELAQTAHVGMIIDEEKVPIRSQVKNSCEIMGFDPIYIANEGKFVAILPKSQAQNAIKFLRNDSLGEKASIIGEVTADHPGIVIGKTQIGSKRVIDMPPGELLPRIC